MPFAAAPLNGIATRAFGRDHKPPDPPVGRTLSPRAVEGTTAQGRLWEPSAIACNSRVPTPTKDFGRGGASSPGQGKGDCVAEPPRGNRPAVHEFGGVCQAALTASDKTSIASQHMHPENASTRRPKHVCVRVCRRFSFFF